MYGFVNGLAIVIFIAQLEQFKVVTGGKEQWMQGTQLFTMLALVLLTVFIVYIFPKITKAIPPSLVAIIVVGLIVYFGNISTRTIDDIASVQGGFPPFHIPAIPVSLDSLLIILPY